MIKYRKVDYKNIKYPEVTQMTNLGHSTHIPINKLDDKLNVINNDLLLRTRKKFMIGPVKSSYQRYPYWNSSPVLSNDNNLITYDIPILVPVSNNELGPLQINNTPSYEKNKDNQPMTIVVRKKSQPSNINEHFS